MMDFAKGFAISQLIPKNKFNELLQKWQMDKGVIKFSTEKLLRTLILKGVIPLIFKILAQQFGSNSLPNLYGQRVSG